MSQGTNWGQQRWPRNQGSLLVMKGRAENRDAEPAERATAVRTPLACFSQGHSQHAGGVPTVRCRLLRGLGPRLIGCSRGSRPRALCLRALRTLSEVNQVPECEFRTPSFTSINWRSTPGIVYPAHSHAQSKRKSRVAVIHEKKHQSANRCLLGRPTNRQPAQSMVSSGAIIKAAGAANSVFAATRFGNQKSSAGRVGE